MSTIRAIAGALFILAAGSWSAAEAQCVSGRNGRELVAQGEVMPFPEAARQAGISSDQVVGVQLCRSGGGYVYRVRVLRGGKVRSVNIPAG
jgi:hypothetical protein